MEANPNWSDCFSPARLFDTVSRTWPLTSSLFTSVSNVASVGIMHIPLSTSKTWHLPVMHFITHHCKCWVMSGICWEWNETTRQGCIHNCKYRLALQHIYLQNYIHLDTSDQWANTTHILIFCGCFSAAVCRPQCCQNWSLFSFSSLWWRVDWSQRHHPLSRIPRAIRQLFELRLENFCSRGSRHPSEWAHRSVVWCCNTGGWKLNPFYIYGVGAICCFYILIEDSASFRFRSWLLPQSTTGTRWIFLMVLMAMPQGLVATQVKLRGF